MEGEIGKPIALEAYEQLADSYSAQVEEKPHNAYYDRPAVLSLLPDLKGKRLLEAGCGPGIYLKEMIARGAEMPVGVDVSPRMLSHAKRRVGEKARLYEVDLNRGLSLFEDESFDIVVSPLVLDYVYDWRMIFSEFNRVLAEGGTLIFSVEHPSSDYRLRSGESYFSVGRTELVWKGFDKPVLVPSYRRPLQEMLNPLIQAGFFLEKVLEPLPTEEFRELNRKEFDHLSTSPGFICFKARK